MSLKNKILGSVLFVTVLFTTQINAQDKDWHEDLETFYKLVMNKSGHIFQNYNQEEWDSDYKILLEKSKKMSKNEVRVALMELVAKLKDGHSGIWIQDMIFPNRNTKWFPVRMYYFEEGLYIIAADAKYEEYIGGKVEQIGNFSEKEASEKLFKISNGENKYGDMFKAPIFMMYPPVLNGLGIIKDEEKLNLKIRLADGSFKEIQVASEVYNKGLEAFFVDEFQAPSLNSVRLDKKLNIQWASTKWGLNPKYIVDYQEDNATLYVKLNDLIHSKNDSFSSLDAFNKTWDIVEKKNVKKLIIDLRNNGGGNFFNAWPCVFKIREFSKLNHEKKLIVLTGRKTFSAATAFMSMLETHTNATFIGEPSGGRPNQTEGATEYPRLEHIGVDVVLSTGKWMHTRTTDNREYIAPDILIPESITDWMKGEDRAYNKAHNFKLPFEYLHEGNYKEALRAYKKAQNDNPQNGLLSEQALNSLGYQELRKNNYEMALSVFKINTELYPNSANAFDSLGEAYMLSGDKANAIKYYRKSLQLNPINTNARKNIKEMAQ